MFAVSRRDALADWDSSFLKKNVIQEMEVEMRGEFKEKFGFLTVFVGLREFDTFNVDFSKLTLSLWTL